MRTDYEIAYFKKVDFSQWAKNESIGITEEEGQMIHDFLANRD